MKTREDMERMIKSGESVLYNGRSLVRLEELPSEEELARGNQAEQARLLDAVNQQLRELQDRKARLEDVVKTEGTATLPKSPEQPPAPPVPPVPPSPDDEAAGTETRTTFRKGKP